MEQDEKKDAVREFLEAAGSSKASDEGFLDGLFEKYSAACGEAKAKAAKAAQEASQAAKDAEKTALVVSADKDGSSSSSGTAPKKPEMTLAERRQREALLEQYGYDADDVVENEDGEVEFIYKDRSGNTLSDLSGLGENRNAADVAEKDAKKRAEAKDQHQRNVLRQKELDLREKERKEKAKKRTEKQERHR